MLLCNAKFEFMCNNRQSDEDVPTMNPLEMVRREAAYSRGFAAVVCVVGISAVVCDSWPISPHTPRFNLHAAFGALLWVMAVAQYRLYAHLGSCRRPSRAVYLVLYVVFGGQQLIRAGMLFWNRGLWGVSHPAVLPAPENLRDFLAYGIIALLTIRAMAALHSPALEVDDLTLTFPDLQHHK